ncbi:tyrosinase [Coprinopsis sp. MPI-PUGE-AT-0042]|nr:tyrosinase [Coprinopsis sp. MPI-PUGE-AT-0042]
MAHKTYPITGIRAGWGPEFDQEWSKAKNVVPVRVEVDEFFSNEKYELHRDLLYNAMLHFQHKMSYADKLSYFQVAGIHGLPHVPWDEPGMYAPEYCQHGTVNFATWHRPYMLLFEQRLYGIMVNEIIPSPRFTEEARVALKAAADEFRLPYWDWALKKNRLNEKGEEEMTYDLPLMVKSEKVCATRDDGSYGEVDNPFYCFKANGPMGEYGVTPVQISDDEKGEPYEAIYFDRVMTTSRVGRPQNAEDFNRFYSRDGVNDNKGSAEEIKVACWYHWKDEVAPDNANFKLAEATYRLLGPAYFTSYPQFVTMSKSEEKTEKQDGKFYFSLEGIHNNVHNWTGQRFSHMANIPVAAFDPIFWLHHANIDRLIALWQELNREEWWQRADIKNRHGDVIGHETPEDWLKPFHRDEQGTKFTSNNCRDFFQFGYTYPELQPWNWDSEDSYKASIRKTIYDNYAPPPITQLLLSNSDVVVNVSFPKFALNGVPFTVRVFLAGEMIGEVYNFSFYSKARNGKSSCPNCQRQQDADTILTGQVFMSEELVEAVKQKKLPALDRQNIKKYVKDNLTWKAYKPNGNEVEIPDLKVVPFMGAQELYQVSQTNTNTESGQARFSARSLFADNALFSEDSAAPLDGGITAIDGIELDDLPQLKAKWNDDRTIDVLGTATHSDGPIVTVKVGAWGAYEAF